MSGHMVALVEHRSTGWRYKIMLKLEGDDELRPYWRRWKAGKSRAEVVAAVMELRLSGFVEEIRGLDGAGERS